MNPIFRSASKDKLVLAVRKPERVEITDAHINALARLDVVHLLAENIGPESRFLHVGMTSSNLLDTSLAILCKEAGEKVLIFCNTKMWAERLESLLKHNSYVAALISGDLHQKKRINVLEDFKTGKLGILIATDVASRGIHVDNISHVINFNLPEDPEDYIHRIGRTGRAGATGTSISLVCESDAFMMPSIEALLGESLTFQYPPDQLLAPLQPPHRKSRSPSKPAPRRRR